jgi:hypothetical protein
MKDFDTHTCENMFLIILGGKYIEILISQEEYNSSFLTIMNKFQH